MKYNIEDYICAYPFSSADGERTLHTCRIVKTRKEHQCLLSGKMIPPGSYARHDKALVDGCYWESYYMSLEFLENMMQENGLFPLPKISTVSDGFWSEDK